MANRGLADFLEELQRAGELRRVEVAIDPGQEAVEITRRTANSGGPALLFTATGGEMPLLTNLLGSENRVCRALGVDSLDDMAARIADVGRPAEQEGWFERLKPSAHAAAIGKLLPRRVRSGACQQVLRLGGDIDLTALPAMQTSPDGPGTTLTAAMLFVADLDTPQPIVGRYDLQVLGPDRLAVCWADHDEVAALLPQYARRGEKVPVAAVLGGDPAMLLAAMAPLPPEVNACAIAGLFRDKPIDVVACRDVDLAVPADAEIVIEGYIDPAEPPVEASARCTPLGHYTSKQRAAVMHVVAITHRANPVFPAIVPGQPPNEEGTINRSLARVLLPLAKISLPELVDYDLPTFGAGRGWATLSIEKTYAGQARRVAHAAWGLRQFMFAKFLVVVDADVDVHDEQQVMAAIAASVAPAHDVEIQQGPPDPLDAATLPNQLGHRMVIDATRRITGEHGSEAVDSATVTEEVRRLVEGRWEEYGLGAE